MKHKRKRTKKVNDKQQKLMTTTTVVSILISLLLQTTPVSPFCLSRYPISSSSSLSSIRRTPTSSSPSPPSFAVLDGWVQNGNGEWDWEEDDPSFITQTAVTTTSTSSSSGISELTEKSRLPSTRMEDKSAPKLPSGSFRPKQSLGQNYLKDGNTIGKIIRAFASDVDHCRRRRRVVAETKTIIIQEQHPLIIELGPGAGALTTPLLNAFGSTHLHCIEIDPRSVELLKTKHPSLKVTHEDVLQVDYPALARSLSKEEEAQPPLSIIGNLPYYITSQILFALADAAHEGCVGSATVTMQWEVARRVVAETKCKDYGILSIVFQLYTTPRIHFKIPPTVFYPQPKVDSALLSLHFQSPHQLHRRLAGVDPLHLRHVLSKSFQQRRKTLRKSLKGLVGEVIATMGMDDDSDDDGDYIARLFEEGVPPPLLSESVRRLIMGTDDDDDDDDDDDNRDFSIEGRMLPLDWQRKRPEELNPGQMIEVTRLIYGPREIEEDDMMTTRKWRKKVWRKLKHGSN